MYMPIDDQKRGVGIFSDILVLNDRSAVSFPELQSFAERCMILVGAALADGNGDLNVAAWAARSKLPTGTLRRFIREFARLGFVEAGDDIGFDRVRISNETYYRLSRV